METTSPQSAFVKLAAVWTGTGIGAISEWPLSKWALLATLVYSVLQIAKLIRDWRLDHLKRKGEAKKEI